MPAEALPIVIFVCSGNSARSVGAEYLCNKLWAGKARWLSAGTSVKRERPKEGVVKALQGVSGVDIDDNVRTRRLDDLLLQIDQDMSSHKLHSIVILCTDADANCPYINNQLDRGIVLVREPIPGPMEMLEKLREGGENPSGNSTEEVYTEFVLNMEKFVRERLPVILPQVLGPEIIEER